MDPDEVVQARLGAAIKAHRERLGLSQSELADASGVHRTYVNRTEQGRQNITVNLLVRIAAALDTSASTLVRGLTEVPT